MQRRQAKAGFAASSEVDAALHSAADVAAKLGEREAEQNRLLGVMEGLQAEKHELAGEAAAQRQRAAELQQLADANHAAADALQQQVRHAGAGYAYGVRCLTRTKAPTLPAYAALLHSRMHLRDPNATAVYRCAAGCCA